MTANQSTSGAIAAAAAQAMALAPGTRLAEYELRSVLGSGGFGIVYLAWDIGLQRDVAIKEYMPATLVGRGPDMAVNVRPDATATTFALGLKSFLNEARLLAQFNHPSLVKVHRFWEANNTAYMVMPYYRGRTLRHVRASMSEPPGDVACRHVLRALMAALDVLHRDDVYHRDIAPDNILLCDDSTPVLLDFGAARKVIGEGNQALTSILKPHYAPLEQYADQRSMRQGPWTDLYALGATLYYFVTGEEPIAAASRAIHDDQPRLSAQPVGDLSPEVAEVVDWMLALKPIDRPQSVQALRDVLDGYAVVPRSVLKATAASHATVAEVQARSARIATDIDPTEPPAATESSPNTPMTTMVLTGNPAVAASMTRPPEVVQPNAGSVDMLSPTVINTVTPAGSAVAPRVRHHGLLLLGLVCINVLAWWWFTRPPAPGSPTIASRTTAIAADVAASASIGESPSAAAAAASADTSVLAGGEPKELIISVLPGRAQAPSAASSVATTGKAQRQDAPASSISGGVTTDGGARPDPVVQPVRNRGATDRPATVATETGMTAATPALTQGPRERCGERNFLSMSVCVKRECDKDPSLRSHPECVKLRDIEEARRSSAY